VLTGQHHRVDAVGLAVHIAHRDLALCVGAQEGQAAVFAKLRLALHETVCVVDGRRHQFGCFIAGVTEHQALVAGARVEVVIARLVDPLRDIVALLVVGHEHGAALVVDAVLGVVVADALDGVARDLDVIDVGVGRDLAREHHQAGVAQRFGRHARAGILSVDGVEDRVGDLVGHLVRMTLGHGLGSEKKVVRHS
jgi:putative ubiquitin-RnfH superfamily antitoxin RatB of RatAB toxin-antitoxin module